VKTIFAAVLTYRLIAFWLPLVPGIIAFFQLRRTVQRWEEDRPRLRAVQEPAPAGEGGAATSESKV
jgi:hypothetical protein